MSYKPSNPNGQATMANSAPVVIASNQSAIPISSLPTGTNTIGNVKVTDGTNTAVVKAASTAAASGDTSLVVAMSPNSPLPSGTNAIGKLAANDGVDIGDVTINNSSIAVTGTFWQATQPVSGTVELGSTSLSALETINAAQSGTWNINAVTSITNAVAVTDNSSSLTVDAPVGTPVFVRLSDGSNAITALPITDNGSSITVDGTVAVTGTFWQATQPVSGTVEIGSTSLAALETINAAQSGTWNVGLSAGTNAIGKLAANAGVIIGAVEIAPATTNTTTNATTTAYAASLIVKASAGTLYSLTGYNSKTSPQFIQIHDSATLPADAAVPKVIFIVPAMSNFAFDLTPYGRSFASGITICNSSTGPTKTIGSADCWFDVQYK